MKNIQGLKELFELASAETQSDRTYLDSTFAKGNHPKTFAEFEYGMVGIFKLRGDTTLASLRDFMKLYEEHQAQVQNKFSVCKEILEFHGKTKLRLAAADAAAGFYCYKK
jgi:hypothetical protein